MRVGLNLLVAMMCATITSPVIAQTTVVGAGSTETATATIRRIDATTRFDITYTEAVLATVTRAK